MAYQLQTDERDFSRFDEVRLHMEKLLSTHLIEFDLPPRIVFPLVENGIKRLGDLVKTSPRELMKIPNIGVTAVGKIKKFMEHHLLW